MKRILSNVLGRASALIIVGAVGVLAGCGGEDGSAKRTDASDSPSDAGSSGSGASGNAGAAGDSTNGGSGGASGSSGTSGSAGKSSTGGSPTIDGGDYSREAFAVDDPDPNDPSHPFEQRETTLLRREEAAVVVPTATGLDGFVLDDPMKAFAPLTGSPAAALAGVAPFDMTRANVDDDGNDELVVVGTISGALAVRIADSDSSAMFGAQDGFTVPGTFRHAWVETADIDNDGRDEILLAAVTANEVVASLYDDATAQFELIDELHRGPGDEIAAAFGNFDDDRAPELALAIDGGSTLTVTLKDDADSDFATLASIQDTATGVVDQWGLTVRGIQLASGNLDGDLRDEIVLAVDGYSTDSNNGSVDAIQTVALDNVATDAGAVTLGIVRGSDHDFTKPESSASEYRYGSAWGWQALVLDSNADGTAELFLLERTVGVTSGSNFRWDLSHRSYGTEAARWSGSAGSIAVDTDVPNNAPAFMAAASGRDDGLGADLVVVSRDGTSLSTRRVTVDTTEIPPVPPLEDPTFSYTLVSEALPARTVTASNAPVWIAGGDWDADSLRLRYTGDKWLELARPRPIVILAAAPAKDGISQNYGATSTGYETSITSSSSQTDEFSVTDKVTLSFEISFPGADFLKAGASASMSEQFTRTNTTTESVSYGKSYSAAYPDDVVIFSGTLCTRYEYEIVGGGEPGAIGTFMTLDVPIESRIYKWTVSYYNEALDGQASPIGDDVLPHTVGDPASYYGSSDKARLVQAGGWTSPAAMAVGQGTGSNAVSISVADENETGTSVTLSTEFAGSAGAFVTAEYSHGWDETEAYSVTVSNETVFQGSVGDVDDGNDYEDYRYAFGLIVHPAELDGGESVSVVQYWTEGLGDGYAR